MFVSRSVYLTLLHLFDRSAQQGGFVIYEHQWWRLISAMFVHAGLIHLACNAYVQVRGAMSVYDACAQPYWCQLCE